MAHLIAYGQLSTINSAISGTLVKAQCDLCGKKYGSLEEAKNCEARHIESAITKIVRDLNNGKVY
ncbi:MAG: hypothetical protein E7398_00135 [Ruminococcaceae bacterium]|nr:hypothetical protein [Oscillospiraceae bacterium]